MTAAAGMPTESRPDPEAKQARMRLEEVMAALFAERHQTIAPDLSGMSLTERQAALSAWGDQVSAASPEGRVELHHVAQTRAEVRARFDRLTARKAREDLAAGTQ